MRYGSLLFNKMILTPFYIFSKNGWENPIHFSTYVVLVFNYLFTYFLAYNVTSALPKESLSSLLIVSATCMFVYL